MAYINGKKILNIDVMGVTGGVGKATPEGGLIFNDYENNKAIKTGSTAFGISNIAGTRAFHIENISGKVITLDSVEGIEQGIGCYYSFKSNNNYDFAGIILSVDETNNTITVDNVPPNVVLTNASEDDARLWVPQYPELGTKAIGGYNFATGSLNKVNQYAAFGCGHNNTVSGKYSLASGINNFVGYAGTVCGQANYVLGMFSNACGTNNVVEGRASFVSGTNNKATGEMSEALGQETEASGARSTTRGYKTVASGIDAVAIGNQNKAKGRGSFTSGYVNVVSGENAVGFGCGCVVEGQYSLASGYGLKTKTQAQTAFGMYNEIDNHHDALFMVGNGTNGDNRSNALVVFKDGSISISGIKITPEQLTKLLALIN